MRRLLLLPLFAALVAPGHAQESPSDRESRFARLRESIGHTYDDTWRTASRLKLDHPVTDEQAWILADAYFSGYISGCGMVKLPIDRRDYWSFDTLVGIGAQKGPEIRVDKRTGTTSSKGRVKIADPAIYKRFLQEAG